MYGKYDGICLDIRTSYSNFLYWISKGPVKIFLLPWQTGRHIWVYECFTSIFRPGVLTGGPEAACVLRSNLYITRTNNIKMTQWHSYIYHCKIPVAVRSKVWVCSRSLTGIEGIESRRGNRRLVSCEYCVLPERGLCDRPRHSSRVWCALVWSWGFDSEEALPTGGWHHIKIRQKVERVMFVWPASSICV